MTDTEDKAAGPPKKARGASQSPIVKIIRELDAGDVEEALSDRLSEVVEALEEHGGKGQLKLTLMMERNEFGRVEVRPKIEAKKPGAVSSAINMSSGPAGNSISSILPSILTRPNHQASQSIERHTE